MTRLNMYDILKESEKKKEIEKKLNNYLKYELSYEDQDKTYQPTCMMYKSILGDNTVHISFESIPLNIKSNKIDPNIFNTALNKLIEKLKEDGYTKEDFSDYVFRLINFSVLVPNPDFKYDSSLDTLGFNFLRFDLTTYLSTSVKNVVYRQEYSSSDLFSGNLFRNVGPLPSIDVDLKKWYDIEYKKGLTAVKNFLKGTVDGVSYDIKYFYVSMFIHLDHKLYKESENFIHPIFKSTIKITLSKFFDEGTEEHDKVKNHIENRLRKFGIDEVEFN